MAHNTNDYIVFGTDEDSITEARSQGLKLSDEQVSAYPFVILGVASGAPFDCTVVPVKPVWWTGSWNVLTHQEAKLFNSDMEANI